MILDLQNMGLDILVWSYLQSWPIYDETYILQ